MYYKFTLLALLCFSLPCLAQETSQEEIISSEKQAELLEQNAKNKIKSDIAQQINDPRNDPLIREYIRNSNDMKKIMNQPVEEIDFSNKAAINLYMQKDAGVAYIPKTTKETSETQTKNTVKYKSKASFDLSGE